MAVAPVQCICILEGSLAVVPLHLQHFHLCFCGGGTRLVLGGFLRVIWVQLALSIRVQRLELIQPASVGARLAMKGSSTLQMTPFTSVMVLAPLCCHASVPS